MSSARFIVGKGGCWLWTGPTNNRGYGCWGRELAHRRMYEQFKGGVLPGLELDHLCRTPLCVNPDHLEPVTHAVNVQRGRAGTVNANRMLARTHCKRGHLYSTENVSTAPGYRRCLACARDAAQDARARRRIKCDECRRVMPPAAFGLCAACYQRRRKAAS